MATSSAYKLKKGETLEQVAKSHKLQVDEIWKYGPNTSLVRKRRTPEKCEPGDLVELPLSKAEKQAAIAKVEGVLNGLKQRSTFIAAEQRKLAELLANLESAHKDWVAGLVKLSKGVKDDGAKADAANMVLGFAASGVGFYKNAREVEKLLALKVKDAKTLAKVAELNHSGAVSAIESLYGPFSPAFSGAATVLSSSETSDNAFLSYLGTAADVFGQLTSPSGWAEFITGAGKDLAEARRQIDDNYARMKSQILRKQNALQEETKSVQAMLNALGPALQNMKKG